MEHGWRRARRGRLLAAGEGDGRGGGEGGGVVTDVCECAARGGARWLDMKVTTTTAHIGTWAGGIPALRVRDSTAAAATMVRYYGEIQRYSQDIPKIYARGGG